MGFFVLVDNVINTLCILLMSSWYDPLYDKLCCCCSKTVAHLDDAISSKSKTPRTLTGSHFGVGSYEVSSTSNMSSTTTVTTTPMTPRDGVQNIPSNSYRDNENVKTQTMIPMETVNEDIEKEEYSHSEVP